jgi:hypothetical protein
MMCTRFIAVAVMFSACYSSADRARADVLLEHVWTHDGGGSARAEIVAYSPALRQFLVTSSAERCVKRLDARNGREIGRWDVSTFGQPTSVAAHGTLVAIAVAAPRRTDAGHVVLYSLPTGAAVETPNAASQGTADERAEAAPWAVVRVGALPDMLTFTPDGRHILVANEGEPSDDYMIDPEGSISVIELGLEGARPVVLTADFLAWNGKRDELERQGVRLSGPGRGAGERAHVVQDLEPEYISVSADGRIAWVTLQENNALAILDVPTARVTRIVGLGYKDHSRRGAGLDASDRDGGVHIRNWPLWGMYQPDGVAAFTAGGETFLATANEGDARDYPAFADEARVAELALAPDLLRHDPALAAEERLGRLKVSRVGGDTNADGKVERLLAFGARSLAVWTAEGQLVYDSGDAIEQFIAAKLPARFNVDEERQSGAENRSTARGPEPEGVVVGRVGQAMYAFVGLERTSAIALFDVSRPRTARLESIICLDNRGVDDRSPAGAVLGLPAGARNVAPEGLVFVPADESPLGEPLLAVACEVSGTTVLFRVRVTP